MTLTTSQLQARIEGIERWINTLQSGLDNTASRREMKNIIALLSAQVTSLQDQVGNLDSTGVLYPPRFTTTERNALTVTKAATVFNTTSNMLNIYDGSNWQNASFSESGLDHGSISGLTDDDHTHYLLVNAARNVTNDLTFEDGFTLTGGNITSTVVAVDWDLIDNNASALSFNCGGHEGLLVLDTTNDAEMVRVGATAGSADFPKTRMFVSQDDSGQTNPSNIGLAVEAKAGSGALGIGMLSVGSTSGPTGGYGAILSGIVENSADTNTSTGLYCSSTSAHAGGANVGAWFSASNGATNTALKISAGDINTTAATDWDLKDNDSAALSFDCDGHEGLLVLDTTTNWEQVRIGAAATRTDFPCCKAIISRGDAGVSRSNTTQALVIEAPGSGTEDTWALLSYGQTTGVQDGVGVVSFGVVSNTADSGEAIGVASWANATHAGGPNIALNAYAANGAINTALRIQAGDIHTEVAVDWDLADDDAEALSFDTAGHTGLLVLDTTDSAEMIRVGATAASADVPKTRMFVSQSDTTYTETNLVIGLIAEATAGDNFAYAGSGLIGVGRTSSVSAGFGVTGIGKVSDTSNGSPAYGMYSYSYDTHAGGNNIALGLWAANGSQNIALELQGGDIDSSQAALTWGLIDDNSSALNFGATGMSDMLVFDTTDGVEGVKFGGYIGTSSGTKLIDGGTDGDIILANAAATQGIKFSTSVANDLILTDESGNAITLQSYAILATGIIYAPQVRSVDFGTTLTIHSRGGATNQTTGDVDVRSGDNTNASPYNTGAVNLFSGDSTAGNSGSVTVDTGSAVAGTVGVVTISTGSNLAMTVTNGQDVELEAGLGVWGVTAPASQPTHIADVTGTADGTYDSTEQNMLNDLVTAVNAIIAVLEGAGLAASA